MKREARSAAAAVAFALVGIIGLGVAGVGAPVAAAQPLTFVARTERSLSVAVRPTSGPAGTQVALKGSGFNTSCPIGVSFTDADGSKTWLANLPPEATFKVNAAVPIGSAPGPGAFSAQQGAPGYPWYCGRGLPVSAAFDVTH
jgi:hypothetical protein